jgi:hypothetical protein
MSRAVEFLRAAQNADGGWGYKFGGMSFVEPTAAVILALVQDAANMVLVQRARAYLKNLQHADGGWGIAAVDDESGWMTAWAVWALASSDAEAAPRGAEWLLQNSGIRVTDPKQIERIEKVLKIDASITGWSWQPGDAAWIFPTALALLALDAMQMRHHPRAQEGIRYLLDRAIATGGWNIGNPFMITSNLPPTVESTALALRALAAYGIENDVVRRAAGWLAQENFTPTAFEWAWRVWYWTPMGQNSERARAALNALQRADGSWDGNPFTTAIAMMGTYAA